MTRPHKLPQATIDAWLATHAGWEHVGTNALTKSFKLPDFGTALALAVRIGVEAEKRDHHPDIELGWGKLKVLWSTHDAGGVTQLDLELAEATDRFAG
jgi:4a-hydroxytetrahydrobiopterin dehydratase